MRRSRYALAAAVFAALVTLIAAGAWAALSVQDRPDRPGYRPGMMGGGAGPGSTYGPGMTGGGMMAGQYAQGVMGGRWGLPGDGRRVDSLASARQRAQVFADRGGLRASEVMQFANNFYVELVTSNGSRATEVLVWPGDGAVGLEYGPAMLWNSRYGMHPWSVSSPVRVSAAHAKALAQRWLNAQGSGMTVGEAEEFPGYYTLHTLVGATISGMLSVNASTGAVWYHTWHGGYIAMSEG
jgi:hypothetical protein